MDTDTKKLWISDATHGFVLGKLVDIGADGLTIEPFDTPGKVRPFTAQRILSCSALLLILDCHKKNNISDSHRSDRSRLSVRGVREQRCGRQLRAHVSERGQSVAEYPFALQQGHHLRRALEPIVLFCFVFARFLMPIRLGLEKKRRMWRTFCSPSIRTRSCRSCTRASRYAATRASRWAPCRLTCSPSATKPTATCARSVRANRLW